MRKIAAVLSLLLCLTFLFGCGKEIPVEPGPKDVIYKSAPFTPKGESFNFLSDFDFDGEAVYMLVTETEASENGTLDNNYLLKVDLSGNVLEKILLSSVTEEQAVNMEFSYYSGIDISEDGKVYLIRMTVENPNSNAPDMKSEIISIEGETQIVLVDVSGKLAEAGVGTSNLYVSDFTVNNKGFAYIKIGMDAVYAFDLSSGEIVSDFEPDSKDTKSDYGFDSLSIYRDIDGVCITVADLPASGVNLNEITKLFPVSDTQFLLSGYTGDQIGIPKLYILTKVDPEDVPDKSIIKVAAVVDDLYLPEYITKFTASHPEYQIEYKPYTEDMYAQGKAIDDALNALNTDLAAGNVPDVLLIDRRMNYGNYVRKGLFTDLYPLIDADPDYSREEFLKPFLSALETDGKLYSLAPAFSADTLIGKTSIFGEKKGQCLDELEAAAAKIHGASLFGSPNRDYFTDSFLMRMYRRFVDEEKGVCSFDSPEFISLLEYAKTLPPPAPDAEPYMSSTWWPDETGDYRENIALVQAGSFMTFRDVVAIEKMDYGEPITFLGFPNSSGGTGIQAYARLETAIMDKASNPDGAWEFVKGLQTYSHDLFHTLGYQPLWYFPALVSELDIAAKNATIPAFEYLPQTGERMPRQSWLGPDLTDLPVNTEADNAKIYELFDNIDSIRRDIPAIRNIIKEETATYFASDKSAEETAAMIQNRATTYLEEMK
jgi:ABC-type glycerol-3-phosphate transport system substrate-binding protein